MDEENVIVLCCQCGCHYKQSETRRLKIENIPIDIYICGTCLDNIPQLSEYIGKPLKIV